MFKMSDLVAVVVTKTESVWVVGGKCIKAPLCHHCSYQNSFAGFNVFTHRFFKIDSFERKLAKIKFEANFV